MRLLVFIAMLAAPIGLSGQTNQVDKDAFIIVRGTTYEGAIIPDASPWHKAFRTLATAASSPIARETLPADSWTPRGSDVAVVEQELTRFVQQASSKERAGTTPPARDLPNNRVSLLAATLPTLKRQYAGLGRGGGRSILVHGFPDDAAHRWRTEAVTIMGGACRQFWVSFSVAERRIVRAACASDE
jgi:hypothetical protein